MLRHRPCRKRATLSDARARAYEACGLLSFEGMQYRRDIAERAMEEEST